MENAEDEKFKIKIGNLVIGSIVVNTMLSLLLLFSFLVLNGKEEGGMGIFIACAAVFLVVAGAVIAYFQKVMHE